MTKYTAGDFANARFAEHESGDYAHRMHNGWVVGSRQRHSDEDMASDGWVPVPTKPQITESQCRHLYDEAQRGPAFFGLALVKAGIEVIPNPEPTNLEKLLRIIGRFEIFDAEGREAAQQIAQILDNNNVIVKGN